MAAPGAESFIVDAVVPARNAADTLPALLAGLPRRRLRSVVVVDRGSSDGTAQVATDAGAVVLREPAVGYGAACQRAIRHLEGLPVRSDAVVFVPADGAVDPGDVADVVAPLRSGTAELVIGVRRGSAPPRTRVAIGLISAIYGHRFADLGPLRAIRFPALIALAMVDRASGWNVEMQVKALKLGLHIVEVPVGAGDAAPSTVSETLGRGGRVLFRIVRNATAR